MSEQSEDLKALREAEREDAEERPERCKNCRFYQPSYTDGDRGIAMQIKARVGFTPMGECHRFPPSIRKLEKEPTWFPEVMSYYWCGEWQAKPEKPATSSASSGPVS